VEHYIIGNYKKVKMIKEVKDKIVIASDFSDTLGARYRKDGPHSAEEFLENHLEPKFIKAMSGNEKLLIDLDGVWGYPSSFVSGTFGILSMKYSAETVLDVLEFKSEDNSIRLEKIIFEIKRPKKNIDG